MLALTAPLMLRLQHLPQLAGWDVRTNTEPADRQLLPAADVRCTGANVPPNQTDIVTLSPACAAFDQFANFMERGKAFKKLVMGLGE